MSKKTLFVISFTIIFMLFTVQHLLAEESDSTKVQVFLNEDFENYSEGIPSGWQVFGSSDNNTLQGYEKGDETGNFLKFTLGGSDKGDGAFTLSRTFSSYIVDQVILQARVKVDRTDFYIPFFHLRSSDDAQSAVLVFNGNGEIVAGDRTIGEYVADRWYDVAIAIDLEKEKLDVYVDGEIVEQDIEYARANEISNIKTMKLYSKEQPDKILNMDIDYIRAYSGTQLQSDNFFENEDGDESTGPSEDIEYDPSPKQVISDLKDKNPNMDHPRLFAREEDFQRIKSQLDNDPYLSKWYKDLRKKADKYISQPVGKYETPDGRRMPAAKEARPVIETTALMYILSAEEKYAKRAKEEILAMIEFQDWNHQNEFLNTAEMTAGVAIGYDWLYDYLSEEERDAVREAIKEKGLKKAIDAHKANAWWVSRDEDDTISNWNAVSNGGIIMGALAIGDEEEEVSGDIIARSLYSLEDYILSEFDPDGGWAEGPGYWRYTVEYLVSYMASLDSTIGKTYGHKEKEGLYKTAYFPLYMTGAQGSFNFGDASSNKMRIPELLWLGKQVNDKAVTGQRLLLMESAKQAGGVYDILWYDADGYDLEAKLDLDRYFRRTEVATFRSKWNDPYALFAGLIAGRADESHSHSDIGSFIFEAIGEKWVIDLGSDDYGLPGYFNYDKERYTYYRLKPEGHNTIVINPDEDFQQDHKAINEIIEYESKPKGGYAITDMTPAYSKNAKEAHRGLMMGNNRGILIIQDEIQTKDISDIWWFMHTKADIQVSEQGDEAILTQNGKQLKASIVLPDGDPINATFKVMAAEPLPTSPNPSGQESNEGIQKLAIEMNGVNQVNLSVVLEPLEFGQEVTDRELTYVPLDQWSIPEGKIKLPTATKITVEGELLEGFDPERFYYDVKLPFGTKTVPVIEAKSEENIEVIQAKSLLEPAQVIVTNKENPDEQTKYIINFSVLPSYEIPDHSDVLDIIGVEASDAQEGNPAEHAIDGDFDTRWSAENEQWIQLDLGQQMEVSTVGLSLFRGHERSSVFEVEVSEDGEFWEKVYVGSSTGTTEDMEYYSFIEKTARYVRVIGNGNSSNAWNSYNEVEVLGNVYNEPPVIHATNQTIKIGESFNPLVGVTATDAEDGDITKNIEVIKDNLNVDEVGQYEIIYQVMDSGGKVGTQTIVISVKENSDIDPGEGNDNEAGDSGDPDPEEESTEKPRNHNGQFLEEEKRHEDFNYDSDQDNSGDKLPNTATSIFKILLGGLITLVIGVSFYIRSRPYQYNKN